MAAVSAEGQEATVTVKKEKNANPVFEYVEFQGSTVSRDITRVTPH